jgi:hypothetical protein
VNDNLFDETCAFNLFLSNINASEREENNLNVFLKALRKNKSPNLRKIIEAVFASPISNASVERIFSKMKKLWRDDRSSMNIGMVKAEICILENFEGMECEQFNDYIKEKREVIKAASSSKKYKHKFVKKN